MIENDDGGPSCTGTRVPVVPSSFGVSAGTGMYSVNGILPLMPSLGLGSDDSGTPNALTRVAGGCRYREREPIQLFAHFSGVVSIICKDSALLIDVLSSILSIGGVVSNQLVEKQTVFRRRLSPGTKQRILQQFLLVGCGSLANQ